MKWTDIPLVNGWGLSLAGLAGGLVWVFSWHRRFVMLEARLKDTRGDIAEIQRDIREIHGVLMGNKHERD